MWEFRIILTDLSLNILVLFTKGNVETRGIGLIEVLWKVVTSIIDTRIKMVVVFQDILHGIHTIRGM